MHSTAVSLLGQFVLDLNDIAINPETDSWVRVWPIQWLRLHFCSWFSWLQQWCALPTPDYFVGQVEFEAQAIPKSGNSTSMKFIQSGYLLTSICCWRLKWGDHTNIVQESHTEVQVPQDSGLKPRFEGGRILDIPAAGICNEFPPSPHSNGPHPPCITGKSSLQYRHSYNNDKGLRSKQLKQAA